MIKLKVEGEKPEVDLTGPQGNAFVLMGYATRWARDLGKSRDEIAAIQKDMQSGDYEHLLSVIEKHFGDYVILYR